VITHENRDSKTKDINAPFTRINDGCMYLFGMKRASKLEALGYLNRVSEGTHLGYEKFFYKKVTEVSFKNPKGSRFCIDGEPIQCSEYTVKLLPGFINLMGKINKN